MKIYGERRGCCDVIDGRDVAECVLQLAMLPILVHLDPTRPSRTLLQAALKAWYLEDRREGQRHPRRPLFFACISHLVSLEQG